MRANSGLSSLLKPQSVGSLLHEARLRRNWTVKEVAQELQFTQERIEDIEGCRWEKLPEPVFVQGYLRSYARLLGVDVDEVMTRYNEGEGSNVSARKMGWLSGGSARPTNLSELWFKMLVLSLVLLGGSMVFIWWYGNKQQSNSQNQTQVLQQTGDTLNRRYPNIDIEK